MKIRLFEPEVSDILRESIARKLGTSKEKIGFVEYEFSKFDYVNTLDSVEIDINLGSNNE